MCAGPPEPPIGAKRRPRSPRGEEGAESQEDPREGGQGFAKHPAGPKATHYPTPQAPPKIKIRVHALILGGADHLGVGSLGGLVGHCGELIVFYRHWALHFYRRGQLPVVSYLGAAAVDDELSGYIL